MTIADHINKKTIVQKPWGYEEWWAMTGQYVAKLIFVRKGHRLSLQYHRVKEETMRVLKGVATIQWGDERRDFLEGETVHIPPGVVHRLEARYGDVSILEVSTTEVEDVVRVSDDYAR